MCHWHPDGVGTFCLFNREGPRIPYMLPYVALSARKLPHVDICCHILLYVVTFCHDSCSGGTVALLRRPQCVPTPSGSCEMCTPGSVGRLTCERTAPPNLIYTVMFTVIQYNII